MAICSQEFPALQFLATVHADDDWLLELEEAVQRVDWCRVVWDEKIDYFLRVWEGCCDATEARRYVGYQWFRAGFIPRTVDNDGNVTECHLDSSGVDRHFLSYLRRHGETALRMNSD